MTTFILSRRVSSFSVRSMGLTISRLHSTKLLNSAVMNCWQPISVFVKLPTVVEIVVRNIVLKPNSHRMYWAFMCFCPRCGGCHNDSGGGDAGLPPPIFPVKLAAEQREGNRKTGRNW